MLSKIKSDKLSSVPSSFTTVAYHKSSNNVLCSMSFVCKYWAKLLEVLGLLLKPFTIGVAPTPFFA